ncbi:MAG: App1 family protein [Weeksellaceae bacterium]|nr:App1 family protein [Weeksellaceae bacterium]
MYIKIYHGFGSRTNVLVFGHVFESKPHQFSEESSGFFNHLRSLLSLFMVKPMANVHLELDLFGNKYHTTSDENGWFKFQFDPPDHIEYGWQAVRVCGNATSADDIDNIGEGKILIAQPTTHSIISDIDDTVMKSYSATIFRRLYELLGNHPTQRKLFHKTVEWYMQLAETQTQGLEQDAFFYVSSSEWNLYDYLKTVFHQHGLPEGIFMLNDLKQLRSFFKTGKTGHEGKLVRIKQLLETFPDQNFILIGDNTQQDPYIYHDIAQEFPNRILSVMIRNKKKSNYTKVIQTLEQVAALGIPVLQFDDTKDAIDFSHKMGFTLQPVHN